jgi:limonene-1,2-epoxide hydrolase
MDDLLKRFWPDLIDRLHGPLTFRLILQPLSAAFIAFRAGLRDARAGRPAYGWAVLTNRADRLALLKQGWRELTRVFVFAVVMDLIYEKIVFHDIRPVQSLVVAALLALLPYPLFRGVVNRIIRRWRRSHGRPDSNPGNVQVRSH